MATTCLQAHFSPRGAALGAPLQSSLQSVDPLTAAGAATAAARYNPQMHPSQVRSLPRSPEASHWHPNSALLYPKLVLNL